MKASLQRVLQIVKAFDKQGLFKTGNRSGYRTFEDLYKQLNLWIQSVECRYDMSVIYYDLIQGLNANAMFVDPGTLKEPEVVHCNIGTIRYNGRDDFILCFNLAMDGYLTSLSSLLDSLAQIANALAFKKEVKNVSFVKLAKDCNERVNSFEVVIADNYFFPGNKGLVCDTWTNAFKDLRNLGIHQSTFFPSTGTLRLANPGQPTAPPRSEIAIEPAFFAGLPSTNQHDISTYTELLHSRADSFIKDALRELCVWLIAQHNQGHSIPHH